VKDQPEYAQIQNHLSALSTSKAVLSGDLGATINEVSQLLTKCLNLNQVSIWTYHSQTKRKPERFQRKSFSQSSQETVPELEMFTHDQSPNFFEVIKSGQAINATDASENEQTSELKDFYLGPESIHSLLSIPIMKKGRLWGLANLESVYTHDWKLHEILFAQATINFIALSMETSELKRTQEELESQEEQFMESYLAEMDQMAASTTTKQEEHEAHIRQILDALPVGVFVLDKEGQPFYANPESQRILGQSPDTSRQFSLNDLNHNYPAYRAGTDDLYPESEHPMNRALQGEKIEVNDMEVHHPDKVLSLNVNASPIKDEGGYTNFAIAVYSDISHMKETEEKLIDARQKAEDANRAKGQFLANMSHEIRTPMNAIIGLSHLFTKTKLTNKQADYLHKIQGAAQNLLGIINDILDFSKVDANMLHMEAYPL